MTVRATAVLVVLILGVATAPAAEVIEPRTRVAFPDRVAGMVLLGTGVRTRTLLRVQVYAIALYAAEEALRGRAEVGLHQHLVWGDFRKRLVLHFVRSASPDQIKDAFIESLPQIPRARIDVLVSHFPATRAGQQYVFEWAPGGVLRTTVLGKRVPDIADKEFATAVFAIWLGPRPVQEDIKLDLVARVPLLRR